MKIKVYLYNIICIQYTFMFIVLHLLLFKLSESSLYFKYAF